MIFRKKDDEYSIFTGMHFSDWLVILLAAVLTSVAIYLLVTPENFGAEFSKAAKAFAAPGAAPGTAQPAPSGPAPAMIFKNDKKK